MPGEINNNIPVSPVVGTPVTNTNTTTNATSEKDKEKARAAFSNILTEEEAKAALVVDPKTGKKIFPQKESLEALRDRRAKAILEQREKTTTYGKDMYLQLMVAQMKYQDPLEPMDNKDMLNQMAMFTSVEQLSNLNTNFADFAKDFKGKDEKGIDKNILVEEVKRLNANLVNISKSMGVVPVGADGKDSFEKFYELYEKTYTDLFKRLESLESEIKNLAKLV